MIISMEAAVRALDEQKKELEKVISALKQEEAEEDGMAAENAGIGNEGVDAGDTAADDAGGAANGNAAVNDEDEASGDTEELEVTDSSNSF
jgi:peptidoglycan hydrolase CwlO-like protein